MRTVCLIALVGCGGGATICSTDGDCSGQVCARDEQCYPASQIRSVVINWTVSGAAPTATSCASIANLVLQFDTNDLSTSFEFEPVPCIEGKFTLDKLPTIYTQVDLGSENDFAQSEPIGSDNTVSFDLIP